MFRAAHARIAGHQLRLFEMLQPTLTLVSGQTLKLQQLFLYDEGAVLEIARLRTQAAKALGGTGVGVGVLGTPSLELAAEAVALGVISGILASAAQKGALDSLKSAQHMYDALSDRGLFFDIGCVANASLPRPAMWRATADGRISRDVSSLTRSELDGFLSKHSLSRDHVVRGRYVNVVAPVSYVHSGDEFIRAMTDIGDVNVRWSHVTSYGQLSD